MVFTLNEFKFANIYSLKLKTNSFGVKSGDRNFTYPSFIFDESISHNTNITFKINITVWKIIIAQKKSSVIN